MASQFCLDWGFLPSKRDNQAIPNRPKTLLFKDLQATAPCLRKFWVRRFFDPTRGKRSGAIPYSGASSHENFRSHGRNARRFGSVGRSHLAPTARSARPQDRAFAYTRGAFCAILGLACFWRGPSLRPSDLEPNFFVRGRSLRPSDLEPNFFVRGRSLRPSDLEPARGPQSRPPYQRSQESFIIAAGLIPGALKSHS